MESNQGMTRYSVSKVVKMILRRWYWLLVFAVLFALIFVSFFWTNYNSTYQISSTFFPVSSNTNYYTASALIKNDEVLNAVKKSVNFDTSIGELNNAIQIDVNQTNSAAVVKISWDNQDEAIELLQALKANLTFAVTHAAEAGSIIWMDAVSSASGQPPISTAQSYQVIFIGVFIGLLAGIGFSFFLAVIDKRVFDLETVRYGGNVNVIGVVGKIKETGPGGPHGKNAVMRIKPNKQFIATALYLNKLMESKNKKLLMCIAPTKKCGTSTVARNLAKVLSGIKKDIMIVRLDIVAQTTQTDEPSIRSVFPGVYEFTITWNNQDSYGSLVNEISGIVSLAESKCKFILLDCPAMLENVQLSMLAEGMDATLIVCKYGKTKQEEVQSMVSLLSRSGVDPIYCTWNCAETDYDNFYPFQPAIDEGRILNEQT